MNNITTNKLWTIANNHGFVATIIEETVVVEIPGTDANGNWYTEYHTCRNITEMRIALGY